MGRVAFTEENVVKKGDYDFPKLGGLKKGEKARIVLFEEPWAEYVHTLRKPVVVDGVPIMTTRERVKGPAVTEHKMEFVSRIICLGDEGTVAERGSDPDKCPMCHEAKVSDRVSAPQRRFAMHVLKYATKPKTHDVQTPFSAQTLIWSFTDKVFGKIFEFKKEWEDLRKHDLLLICENDIFQTYDLSVSQKAAYMSSKENTALAIETFKNNQTPDPAIFCGQRKEKRYVEMDLETIRDAWNLVKEYESGNTEGGADLDTDLDSLIETKKKQAPTENKVQEDWAVSSDDLSDLIGADPAKAKTEDAAPAAADDSAPEGDDFASLLGNETPVVKESKSAPADDDYDDLLAGLSN